MFSSINLLRKKKYYKYLLLQLLNKFSLATKCKRVRICKLNSAFLVISFTSYTLLRIEIFRLKNVDNFRMNDFDKLNLVGIFSDRIIQRINYGKELIEFRVATRELVDSFIFIL